MAANKSRYLEDKLIDHALVATAFASPATVFAALYTVAPTKTTAGTEVSDVGTAYARVNCGATAVGGKFSASSGGTTANDNSIVFPTATDAWGIVVAVAILDSDVVGAGNILYFGDLTAGKTVDSGDTVTFATGTLTVAET
jgi:hypothetical protein